MSLTEEPVLASLLFSPSCELPCYLGITPGTTTREIAERQLASIGAWRRVAFQHDGLPTDEYVAWIGDPSLRGTPRAPQLPGGQEIALILILTFRDGVVARLTTEISTEALIPKYMDYWERYSSREILIQYGLPDILVGRVSGSFYDLMVVYAGSGIVMEATGTTTSGARVCPNSETGLVHLRLTLTDPDSGLSIYSRLWPRPDDRRYWDPIEDVAGVDQEEFYSRVVSDPEACFDILKPP